MAKTESVDEGIIDAPPIIVRKALDDETTGITHWWPKVEFKLKAGSPAAGENKVFDMIAHGPMTFKATLKVTKIVEGQSIMTEYIGGHFIGTGEWILEPVDGGKTRLIYKVKAQRKGLASILPESIAKKAHSEIMQEAFKSLNEFLKNKN